MEKIALKLVLIIDDYLPDSTRVGAKIWRFRSGPIKDVGRIQRAMNETFLSLKAWKAVQSLISPSTFDGVIYYSPTIFWGGLVRKIKKRCNCPSYLVLRDLFPRWVVDAGIIKEGSFIERYFRFFEKYSYQQANCIGLMSERNLEVFQSSNVGYHCEILRNWASLTPVMKNEEILASGKNYFFLWREYWTRSRYGKFNASCSQYALFRASSFPFCRAR